MAVFGNIFGSKTPPIAPTDDTNQPAQSTVPTPPVPPTAQTATPLDPASSTSLVDAIQQNSEPTPDPAIALPQQVNETLLPLPLTPSTAQALVAEQPTIPTAASIISPLPAVSAAPSDSDQPTERENDQDDAIIISSINHPEDEQVVDMQIISPATPISGTDSNEPKEETPEQTIPPEHLEEAQSEEPAQSTSPNPFPKDVADQVEAILQHTIEQEQQEIEQERELLTVKRKTIDQQKNQIEQMRQNIAAQETTIQQQEEDLATHATRIEEREQRVSKAIQALED